MTTNLKTFVKLLRLSDVRGYLLLALFGFLLAEGFLFPFKDIFLFWAIVFFGAGFCFSINECFGQNEDVFNKTKKNPLVAKKISFKKALTFSLFLGITALILAFISGLESFLLCLFGGLLVFTYVFPPFKLKSRPPWDLISHGLFGGPFILLLPFLFFKTTFTSFHYLLLISAFYFSIILQLRNEFEDYQADKLGGLKTTAHILGFQRTEKLLKFLAIFYPPFLFLIFYFFLPNFLFPFFALTLIFWTLFLFFEKHKLVKNYKLFDGYNILAYVIILIGAL